MTNEILKIIGGLLGAAFVYGVTYITPKIREWLIAKIGLTNYNYLEVLIGDLTAAADQLYKADDPNGEMRNHYVKTELENLGYVINAKINAIIESKVYALPHNK